MSGILIVFHTPSNAGYAMAPLERTFFDVALELFGSQEHIHFAFRNLEKGMPTSLPEDFKNVISLDMQNPDTPQISEYISSNNISAAFCFDLQPHAELCKIFRKAGVKSIISYWGSTISGYNSGLKLAAKKIEVALRQNKPDLFIFESKSMQSYATQGRGISPKHTAVIPTGIDESKFCPDNIEDYLSEQFNIPKGSRVAFYSGHMEERKGVSVIMNAAKELVDVRNRSDLYFLICGNRPGEEQSFITQLGNSKAANNVVFAGYRNDLNKIMPCCDLGLIASTGWDSFPMSSIEMAACGLPLVVSDLQGLVETIIHEETGLLFTPGDHIDMANKIEKLLDDETLYQQFSTNGRARILKGYTKTTQKNALISALKPLIK